MMTIEQACERTNDVLEQERKAWRMRVYEQMRSSGAVPLESLNVLREKCKDAKDSLGKQADAMLARGIDDGRAIGRYIAYAQVLEWLDELLGPQE